MSTAETVRVKIPRRDGAPPYEGVVVLLRDAEGAEGAGECAVLGARGGGWSAAEEVAREIAELDLRARREGVRVADLLGGVRRTRVECTALVTAARPPDVVAEVERSAADGFRAFKLKSANAGGAVDGERLGGARWAAGSGARLRVDFNGGLDERRAAAVLPTLEHFGLELVEQPVAAAVPPEAWLRLRTATHTPLAADESLGARDAACRLAAEGFVLAIKLATAGGPAVARSLAAAATGPLTIGSGMESSLGIAAALHLACALPVEPLASGLATAGRLEGDLASGLASGPVMELPGGPGLGVEVDRAALQRYRVA